MSSRSFRAPPRASPKSSGATRTRSGTKSRPISTRWSPGQCPFLDLMARLGQKFKRPAYGDEIDYEPQSARTSPTGVHEAFGDRAAVAQVEPRRGHHARRSARERTAACAHVRGHQHGVLADRSDHAPAGRIFIRRDTHDAPVYRWVLRGVPQLPRGEAFPSRVVHRRDAVATGKLGPPKLGLLRYVVDAYTKAVSTT